MVFTVGKIENFEKYFAEKGKSKSVWQTKQDAEKHLQDINQEEFNVYGVAADWYEDTKDVGEKWRELTHDAKLIRI